MNKMTFNKFSGYRALGIGLLVLCAGCTPVEKIPNRTMGVTSGPETVFDKPVAELMPELAGATATGNNGRVGNELVFWEYQFPDSRKVNFYACAMLDDVNCEARIPKICPMGGADSSFKQNPGLVRHLNCRPVGIVGTGDLLPNCADTEKSNDLLVGVIQCQ